MLFGLSSSLIAQTETKSAQGLTLIMLPATSQIYVKQPIVLQLHLTASTGSTIDLGSNLIGNIAFSTVDTNGLKRDIRLPVPSFNSPGKITIPEGTTYTERVNISPSFSPSVAGTYLVQANIIDDEGVVSLSSPFMPFTVLPYKQAEIKHSAEGLLSVINDATDSKTRMAAADELASTSDSMAVPSLKSALGRGLAIDDVIVSGLIRIGSPEAIDALRIALMEHDRELVKFTRSVLLKLKSETQDRAVRDQINKVLSMPGPEMTPK